MAHPPQVRLWSRLASLRSSTAPPPEPHPPSAKKTTLRITTTPPSPPPTQPSQPLESNVVPAPYAAWPSQPPKTSSTLEENASVSATKSPQKITKPTLHTPMQSQKLNKPQHSPLASLPPSQKKVNLEVESKKTTELESRPKTVLVQKESSSQTQKQGFGHHDQKQGTTNEKETKGNNAIHTKLSDFEESGIRVITISGENKGAYMKIFQSSSKKPNYLHNKKGYEKIKAHDFESGNSNRKDKNTKETPTSPSHLMTAYMNSNVQCVNNSLMYHTSCTHHDPGVHFSL